MSYPNFRPLFQLVLFAAALCFSVSLRGQNCSLRKLTASDAAAFDRAGGYVSVGKTYAIVGSSAKNNEQGVAYIYKFNGAAWQQTAILSGSRSGPYRGFGTSVYIDDAFAIVGTYAQGLVYVFRREGETWVEKAILSGDDPNPNPFDGNAFGWAISVDGPFLMVGAYGEDDHGYNSGAAYIFKREDDAGANWTRQARLVPPELLAGDGFGYSVSISGDVAIATAIYDGRFDDNTEGAVYIFERRGDAWVQQVKLKTEKDYPYGRFGMDVDIYQDPLTGARTAIAGNDSQGVHVYKFVNNAWVYAQFIGDEANPPRGRFGFSVDLEGDHLLVGQPYSGAAWLYTRKEGAFRYTQRFEAPDKHDFQQFGHSVALSDDAANLIVGAVADNEKGQSAGAAYVLAVARINPVRPVCAQGGPLTLTASPAGGAWRGAGITNPNTGTFDPAGAGVGKHEVIYAYGNGCTMSDTITIQVRETSFPVTLASAPVQYLCPGSSVALTAAPAAGQALQWQYAPEKEGVYAPAPGQNDLTAYQASRKGYYRVSSTLPGCTPAITEPVRVEETGVRVDAASLQLCRGGRITLRATATPGAAAFGWQYAAGANGVYTPLPGSAGAEYEAAREGYYRAVATVNGCEQVSDPVAVTEVFTAVSISPLSPICVSHPAVQLEAAPRGGRWVGKGVSESGLFDPLGAGTGNHSIRYLVTSGACEYAAVLTIAVQALPEALLEHASPLAFCENEPATLRVKAVADATYRWEYAPSDREGYQALPGGNAAAVTADKAGFYRVQVDQAGCAAWSPATELVALGAYTKFPNVFTPNGDGFNDTFETVIEHVNAYELEVYNRFGKRVFTSASVSNQWDGKGFPAGVYFYRVRFNTACRKNTKEIKGTVSILY